MPKFDAVSATCLPFCLTSWQSPEWNTVLLISDFSVSKVCNGCLFPKWTLIICDYGYPQTALSLSWNKPSES